MEALYFGDFLIKMDLAVFNLVIFLYKCALADNYWQF